MAAGPLNSVLTIAWWRSQGLSQYRRSLRRTSPALANRLVRTRMLGGVRGRGRDAPSYSIECRYFTRRDSSKATSHIYRRVSTEVSLRP